MKPKNIILIRHGQSEGNVDKSLYRDKPDYAIKLTDNGKEQAFEIGKHLKEQLGITSAAFYVSPYFRTRQTSEEISKSIHPHKYYEDPRLREQEWLTTFRDGQQSFEDIEKERDSYGRFYFRFPNGESGADCFDRVGSFFDTLHRDFEKENFPENAIIITHGMLMRIFLMRWFHYTVEEFELIKNPKNCGIYHLSLQKNSKYKLMVDAEKRDYITHEFIYYEQYRNPEKFIETL